VTFPGKACERGNSTVSLELRSDWRRTDQARSSHFVIGGVN
jgi:hypothetical protein